MPSDTLHSPGHHRGGSLPGLFSGALITETLYSINGIGYVSTSP